MRLFRTAISNDGPQWFWTEWSNWCCCGCFKKPNKYDEDEQSNVTLSASSSVTNQTSLESHDSTKSKCFDLFTKRLFPCWLDQKLARRRTGYGGGGGGKHGGKVFKLLLIGLDNAGKTTLALNLAKESVEDVVATIGFSKYEIPYQIHRGEKNGTTASGGIKRYQLTLYDVGGGARIRAIWRNYYSLVHGIIFVIDSADMERILEVKQLIDEAVSNQFVAGKPFLLFLNKQDIFDAMDEIDVCKFTNVEEKTSKRGCPIKIVPISARNINPVANNGSNDSGKNHPKTTTTTTIDPSIEDGLRWLLETIDDQWPVLNERVEEESQQQINKEKDKMQQRIQRIQQRNFLEVECKVPKPQPESATQSQEDDVPTNILVDETKPNMDENSETETIERMGSTSSINRNSVRAPPLKRLNKIHPTIDNEIDSLE